MIVTDDVGILIVRAQRVEDRAAQRVDQAVALLGPVHRDAPDQRQRLVDQDHVIGQLPSLGNASAARRRAGYAGLATACRRREERTVGALVHASAAHADRDPAGRSRRVGLAREAHAVVPDRDGDDFAAALAHDLAPHSDDCSAERPIPRSALRRAQRPNRRPAAGAISDDVDRSAQREQPRRAS